MPGTTTDFLRGAFDSIASRGADELGDVAKALGLDTDPKAMSIAARRKAQKEAREWASESGRKGDPFRIG